MMLAMVSLEFGLFIAGFVLFVAGFIVGRADAKRGVRY
jgi:hypothetical protein